MLCGNKLDLKHLRSVNTESAEILANKEGTNLFRSMINTNIIDLKKDFCLLKRLHLTLRMLNPLFSKLCLKYIKLCQRYFSNISCLRYILRIFVYRIYKKETKENLDSKSLPETIQINGKARSSQNEKKCCS
jgi:hypothetical protein